MLVEYIQACCPQQVIGEYTSDAWADVLACEPWLTLDDAKAAVIQLKRTRLFIDVSEVITQARETWRERCRLEREEAGPGLLELQRAEREREHLPGPAQVRDLLDGIRRRRRGPA